MKQVLRLLCQYLKILLNRHKPYLMRYVYSLVLENKVKQAINIIKQNYKTLENQIGDLQSRANIQANSTRFLNTAVNNVLTQV